MSIQRPMHSGNEGAGLENRTELEDDHPQATHPRPPTRRLERPVHWKSVLGGISLGFFLSSISSSSNWFLRERLPIHSARTADVAGFGLPPQLYYDGPTFVLTVGIEGTGHHFLQSLITQSPSFKEMKVHEEVNPHLFNIRQAFLNSLMVPYCKDKRMMNPATMHRNVTRSLQAVKNLLIERQATGVSFVPINSANGPSPSDKHQLSYPDSKTCNRVLAPNLDMFYKACEDAKVNCGAIYLYRDPYAVIRSNNRRRFNLNIQSGIHLYTIMLQMIYAQLAYYPEKTLACIGLYDDEAPDLERWRPIRDMYGWKDPHAFQAFVSSIYMSHTEMTQQEKDALIPAAFRVYMRTMIEAHERALQLCRQQLRKRLESYV